MELFFNKDLVGILRYSYCYLILNVLTNSLHSLTCSRYAEYALWVLL